MSVSLRSVSYLWMPFGQTMHIFEAEVMPQDLGIVGNGLAASARFTALIQLNPVPVEGAVVSVSANWLADQFMLQGY